VVWALQIPQALKVARAAQIGSLRLLPNVRIVAIRGGVVVLASNGCFRMTGRRGESFVSEVLPLLCGTENPATSSLDWMDAFGKQLLDLDLVTVSAEAAPAFDHHHDEFRVAVIRHTLQMVRVTEHLSALGIKCVGSAADNMLIIADFSGLDADRSLQLARDVHDTGCRSITFWRHGVETFYGPLCDPRRTACWNCCRLRFSDSISRDTNTTEGDELASAKVITDNVVLALRYPDVAAFGCVVVDSGGVSSVHTVVPVPWCEVCNFGTTPVDSRIVPSLYSEHVPQDLRMLADTRGGVVRRVLLFDSDGTEAPTIPVCASAVIAPHPHLNERRDSFSGEGKGATRVDAVRSAIGEGTERYAASIWDPSTLTRASFSELDGTAFDPRWLVLYDDEQYERPDFPCRRFDGEVPISWKVGHWLDTYQEVQLPALATYMNFPATPAERFGQTTSNGLAAGTTFEDAALRAVYELIERDAFMLSWLAQRSALRVGIDGSDALVLQALREVERLGARTEIYLMDVGTKHPTMMCLGLGDGHAWPGVTIGLGTHANVDIALRRAVFEHGHYGSFMRRLMRNGEHKEINHSKEVVTNLDHGLYYLDPKRSTGLDMLRSDADDVVPITELRPRYCEDATLSACVKRLQEAGIRAAAVDVTPPDIKLAGVRVVRAFGIYMQPIFFGVGNRRLKNPRLDRLLLTAAETRPHPLA